MKKLILITAAMYMSAMLLAQKVGIGTMAAKAVLHVADSNVLFSAVSVADPRGAVSGNPPDSGRGGRMMWYSDKGAFRTGEVTDAQWNKNNIGFYSFASGYNTMAKVTYTTSMGDQTTALEEYATSMGSQTEARGIASTSMGYQTNAIRNTSTSMGDRSEARGFASTSMGTNTKAMSGYSLAIGTFNDITSTNSLFEIGNGTADNARSNAMTVLVNGDVGIGAIIPFAYGHGGTNKILELQNNATGLNIQSHVILSSKGTSGSLGGITWASNSLAGDKRTGFIGSIFQTAVQSELTFYTRNNAGFLGERFYIEGNGNAWLQGALTQNSDARLKKNIKPLQSALENLKQLNGYTYQWKDPTADPATQMGLLAQELQKVYPQLVKENSSGELSVNYMGMLPVLLQAAKEQQQKIEELEKKVNNLKKLNSK